MVVRAKLRLPLPLLLKDLAEALPHRIDRIFLRSRRCLFELSLRPLVAMWHVELLGDVLTLPRRAYQLLR